MSIVQQSVRVGIFFLFGCLLIWLSKQALEGQGGIGGHNGYRVQAYFEDLQQLKIGDEVRLAGIPIGVVDELLLKKGQACVFLKLDKGVELPIDSVVTIATAGLLGSHYIGIQPGEALTYCHENAVLKTKASANINQVVASFGEMGDRLAKALSEIGGSEDKPGLFQNLNHLLLDNRERIDHVIQNFESITTKVNTAQGTLGLLVNERGLYDELIKAANGLRSLEDLVVDARGFLANLQNGKGALGVLVNDPKAADDLKRILDNLSHFSEKLNQDNSTLGRLITDDSLYMKADQVLTKVDGALSTMSDGAPISAVGVAATALF